MKRETPPVILGFAATGCTAAADGAEQALASATLDAAPLPGAASAFGARLGFPREGPALPARRVRARLVRMGR